MSLRVLLGVLLLVLFLVSASVFEDVPPLGFYDVPVSISRSRNDESFYTPFLSHRYANQGYVNLTRLDGTQYRALQTGWVLHNTSSYKKYPLESVVRGRYLLSENALISATMYDGDVVELSWFIGCLPCSKNKNGSFFLRSDVNISIAGTSLVDAPEFPIMATNVEGTAVCYAVGGTFWVVRTDLHGVEISTLVSKRIEEDDGVVTDAEFSGSNLLLSVVATNPGIIATYIFDFTVTSEDGGPLFRGTTFNAFSLLMSTQGWFEGKTLYVEIDSSISFGSLSYSIGSMFGGYIFELNPHDNGPLTKVTYEYEHDCERENFLHLKEDSFQCPVDTPFPPIRAVPQDLLPNVFPDQQNIFAFTLYDRLTLRSFDSLSTETYQHQFPNRFQSFDASFINGIYFSSFFWAYDNNGILVYIQRMPPGIFLCLDGDQGCDPFTLPQMAVSAGILHSACPPGMEKRFTGADSCQFCPAGTFKSSYGTHECAACPTADSYCPRGSIEPLKLSVVRDCVNSQEFDFRVTHSTSPEELLLFPLLSPFSTGVDVDIVSITVVTIYVFGFALMIVASLVWFRDHEHPFIKWLQARDKHTVLKQTTGGKVYMKGSAIGGVLTLISYTITILGVGFLACMGLNVYSVPFEEQSVHHLPPLGYYDSVPSLPPSHSHSTSSTAATHTSHSPYDDENASLLTRYGIPPNSKREVSSFSYHDRQNGGQYINRLLTENRMKFTIRFHGLVIEEGNIWSIATVVVSEEFSNTNPTIDVVKSTSEEMVFFVIPQFGHSIRIIFYDKNVIFTAVEMVVEYPEYTDPINPEVVSKPTFLRKIYSHSNQTLTRLVAEESNFVFEMTHVLREVEDISGERRVTPYAKLQSRSDCTLNSVSAHEYSSTAASDRQDVSFSISIALSAYWVKETEELILGRAETVVFIILSIIALSHTTSLMATLIRYLYRVLRTLYKKRCRARSSSSELSSPASTQFSTRPPLPSDSESSMYLLDEEELNGAAMRRRKPVHSELFHGESMSEESSSLQFAKLQEEPSSPSGSEL
eukprot:TRINITY_DN159_c1_g1_i1.p1 TRINITY_DN159_c1_g1~~TRINITY_DN159_c1_g1_i1.p1  ORF type:complete len:1037 (-),score=171.55 TRINITY_DN159_c1_g1_i1:131-3241(-)